VVSFIPGKRAPGTLAELSEGYGPKMAVLPAVVVVVVVVVVVMVVVMMMMMMMCDRQLMGRAINVELSLNLQPLSVCI
jgi:hypothetical protein